MPVEVVTTVLVVMGMRDNRCRERIAEALERMTGVLEVDVNLFRGRARVVHQASCSPAELIQGVLDAGYQASPDAE